LAARPGRQDRVLFFTQLGKMYVALADYSRAIRAFDDALHDKSKDWEANLERARAFSAIEMNRRAVESYERCIKLRPNAAAPLEELAAVFQRQGFLDKALLYYGKALKIEPKPETVLRIADCHVYAKRIDKATETLEQAKVKLPRAEYDVRLGDIYRQQGSLSKARTAWEEALRANPKLDDVKLKLALIYDQLHRRGDTDRLFQQLLSGYPESPLVHYFRALVLYERGEITASKQEAMVVKRLGPTEIVSHYTDLLLAQMGRS
jgi:tetratricopeptide (TPR) repeat protein